MVKKICQCGKHHTTSAAQIKCNRVYDKNYGFNGQKKQKKQDSNVEIDDMINLRTRQINRTQIDPTIIAIGKKAYQNDEQQCTIENKNILWLNSIQIKERENSNSEKIVKLKALKILWNTRQYLWFTICMYIQKTHSYRNMTQIPKQNQQFWQNFYFQRQNLRYHLKDSFIRKLLKQYYIYCMENQLLLGEPGTFKDQFEPLGQHIIPLTTYRYNKQVRQQYQFYFALEGSSQQQFNSMIRFLKKKGFKKIIKQDQSLFKTLEARDSARRIIAKLVTTAISFFFSFETAKKIPQVTMFNQIFSWMMRLVGAFKEKRSLIYQREINKIKQKKLLQDQQDYSIQIEVQQKPTTKSFQYTGSRTCLAKSSKSYETNKQKQARLNQELQEIMKQRAVMKKQRSKKRALKRAKAGKPLSKASLKKLQSWLEQQKQENIISKSIGSAKTRFNKKRYL